MKFSIRSPCSDKDNSCSDSNLTNLVDVQSLHENDKRITHFSDEIYTVFKKTFLLFHAALLCFIYNRVTVSYS